MAVEDQLVLAADRVAERDEARVVACARTCSISSRSRSLPTWNGEAEMFATSCAPASARSVAGGPGCQMSSQIVGPTTTSPKPQEHEVVARREVAVLVEDAVVRQVALAVDAPHLAVREHEARVVEVGVEVRRADERGDAVRRLRDLLDRAARRADEPGAEQQVLGRVAGDDELGEEDEVGARARAPRSSQSTTRRGVAVDVADDAIDLCECESHRVFASRSKTLARRSLQRGPPPGDVEAERRRGRRRS